MADMGGKPPHKVLDVARDASMDEVKRAYRRLALKHHPDVKGGCKETFNHVNDAYNAMVNNKSGSHGASGSDYSASSPFSRQTDSKAGSGRHGQAGYGTRGARNQQFYTPNPYRSRTARSVRGTQGEQGVRQRMVFDEGMRAAIRSENQRIVQRNSQRAHSRRNLIVCAVPFLLAWGAFEWRQEQRRSELRSKFQKARR